MQSKVQAYARLAEETERRITADTGEWAAFLTTSARLYKYNFQDQLLIYAQRPDATACAEYDLWNNTMRRYIRRGANGIALLKFSGNALQLRYVFDVSDTGTRQNSLDVNPWNLSSDNEPFIRQMLEERFYANREMTVSEQTSQIAQRQALEYWRNHRVDILDSVDGSALSGYDDLSIGQSFRKAAAESIAYTLASRCGLAKDQDFTDVVNWNTPAACSVLGEAISRISGQVLREMEKTIRSYERGVEHDRTEVHEERRLPVSGDGTERNGQDAGGQVRADEAAVSGGEPSGTVRQSPAERQADDPSARNRADREGADEQHDDAPESAGRRDGGTEGAESDAVGSEDEQPAAPGRRDDPLGTDLRLTDYKPQTEQLSLFVSSEANQIEFIDAYRAESTYAVPFAFSVPQNVIDTFLQFGSNTTGHRQAIVTDFSKQFSVPDIALHLQKLYHGGNGFEVNGRKYAAWYAEDGIHIAVGNSARLNHTAQVVSWEDAAKRLSELMEEGQFATLLEIAEAPATERKHIAETLWYLQRDIDDGHKGLLPTVDDLRGKGFPDETATLAEMLADPNQLAVIHQEMQTFLALYEQDRSVLRFHYHKPEALANSISELFLTRRDYDSRLSTLTEPSGFITEDEINANLIGGSSVSGGKVRIYRFFEQQRDSKERVSFLKNEYGIGGRSHALSGSERSSESHDAKGIRLQKAGCPEILVSWNQVASRIDELIRRNLYLSEQEKEIAEQAAEPMQDYPIESDADDIEAEEEEPEQEETPETESETVADIAAPDNSNPRSYHVGDTVYLDNTAFFIEQIGMMDVQLRDPSQRYPVFRAESLERFDALLKQDERNSHFFRPVQDTTQDTVQDDEPIKLHDIVLYLGQEPPHEHEPVPESAAAAENFRITDDRLGEGGTKTKFRRNAEAISSLKAIENEHRTATPEEQTVLSQYVGWGGIPQAFDEHNAEWTAEYTQLKELLTEDEYDAARASTLNAHYTSPVVIRAMYSALEQMGFESGNILEPSCGIGNFFGMIPDTMQNSRLYGVELDSITGRIAKQLYPKADITVAGFETTDRKDFFDLAIGNVPFGAYKVSDKAFDRNNFLIHDYFFAKAIDQVRPGGVIAFITSKGTMDKQSPDVRKYIAQRAELLGAIRLPNNAFRANAGTDVTSDIIFLQKRERPIDIEPDWVHLGQTEDGIPINSYFAQHPEMVLGRMVWDDRMYGNQTETACVPYEGQELSVQLAAAVTLLEGSYRKAERTEIDEDESIEKSIPADPEVKNYSYTVVDGEVYYRRNSIMVQPELSSSAMERVIGMVRLRDCVNELIQAQLDNADDETISALQGTLSTRYDAFSAKYGLINSRGNANAFSDDASYYLLCSLEVINEEGELERKADMFTKRTIRQRTVITHADTATEALAVSISEKARVDLPFMEELTGISKEKLTEDLTGVIFPVPNQKTHTPLYESYVTADEYLSGNVRQKLREAREAAKINSLYLPNVAALETAQPKDLDASEIDVRLGATWVSKEIIEDFMQETFMPPVYLQRYIRVEYSAFSSEWNITGKTMLSSSNVAAYVTYGTDRANAYRILEDTLNLRDIRIYDTITDADGKDRRVLNQKETTLAQQKQQAIKDAFRDWVWRDPNRREALVTKYNELFNSIRPREYDGSHIAFGGMTPEIVLREHQLNAIAHILYGGNTLLAHQVGAGKTFEMVAAAMESKRLGLCQKPLFVVPNHLTEQWASEFLRLYPSASILVATKKDFERANRQKFCARIATGEYDAVIIGHSQFERIPVSQERQQRLLKAQIHDITEGIAELKHHRGEQFSIKQMERTRKQLELRLSKLEAEDKKDHVVTFEQLGVDRLFVDEAHMFKNLFLFTKMRNVAGLSASEAQKSSDMFMKCRYMDEITGGRGTVFATGTPVSNSMTELYTMQRYLQYGMLQQKDMAQFDAWASTFGETTTAIELAPEGTGYRARTRFAKFFNLPELMTMFKEVADIKTADQLHLPTPNAHYETVAVKPSEYQQEMVQALSERAAAIHSGNVDPSKDNMLKITSDGRKLGLDQRLINPLLPDDPGSKVNACVNNILRIWRDGQAEKLTQLVFCDLSTPRGKAATEKEQEAELLAPEETGTGSFNIYDDIRSKLIANGIPAEQIAFIHDANTELRKKELFAKVRSGQVRVLMGSTAKMGAGTNVQDRLIASHDLDCPWRPGDLEQRAGRIVRQGNHNKDVYIYRYVTEGSFDSYLWQTVENKQKFISQIMTSKSPVRSCDDVDETALSYAEIKALCAGDPRIKEKMDLDVDVARLRLMKADHQSKQYRLEDQLLKHFPNEIERDKQLIEAFHKDVALLEAHPLPEKDFAGMTVDGKLLTEKEEAGKAILKACKSATKGIPVPVGTYRGMEVSVQYDLLANHFQLMLRGAVTHRTEVGNSAEGNVIRMDNALASIPKRLGDTEAHLASMLQQMEAAKAEVGKPFPQEAELRTKSARLAELDAELNMDQQSASHNQEKQKEQER